MGLPTEFYVYVGYGIFAMVVVFLGLNFMLGGLLRPFLAVKRSRGSKLLVVIRNQVQDYFVTGVIDEGFLVFKDRKKEERRIPILPGVVSRKAGVYWLEVDDVKNTFIKRDTGEHVSGFDAVKYDELYKRALYKPLTLGDNLLKFVLIIVIVLLLLVIILGVMQYRSAQNVNLILSTLQGMTATAKASAGVVA